MPSLRRRRCQSALDDALNGPEGRPGHEGGAPGTCGELHSAQLERGRGRRDAADEGATVTGQAKGRFITLEGGEGAGKSVQAKRLEERLAGARP